MLDHLWTIHLFRALLPAGLIGSALCLQAPALDFYVAPSGSDTNAGSYGTPFLTLERAQRAVRSALPTASEGINVWAREGTYYLRAPLEFGVADSGSASVPVSYAAYSNETVVLSGAIPLSVSGTNHTGFYRLLWLP